MHLLLVEDDAMLADAVCSGARQNAWTIDCASDALAAKMALVDHAYSAVLLDLGLPHGSGLTVLQDLRARYDATPVLIVTARSQLSDRIRGLDCGADDYVVKPFVFDELWARVRAVVRRSLGRVSPVLTCGDVCLDPAIRVDACRCACRSRVYAGILHADGADEQRLRGDARSPGGSGLQRRRCHREQYHRGSYLSVGWLAKTARG